MKSIFLILFLVISSICYSQVRQTFGAVADNLDSLYTHVGKQNQYVLVLGRDHAYDSLGGVYAYDTASTATEIPNIIFKVIGKDTGRWKAVYFFNASINPDSTTASNGLTLVGKDVQLGGTLTSNTTIVGGSFGTTITTTNASGNALLVSSSTGVGLVAVTGATAINAAQFAGKSTGAGNLPVLKLGNNGSPVPNMSMSIDYAHTLPTPITPIVNQLISKVTDTTRATYQSEFSIKGANSGSLNTLFTLGGNGLMTLNQYVSRAFYQNDTTSYKPMVIDNSGNIYQSSWIGSGGGGGSTNSNIGSGYRLAVPNTNNIKTLHAGTNITMDSVSNANEITITASGGSPAGNFGNLQLNRNSAFAAAASDSLTFNAGELLNKGTTHLNTAAGSAGTDSILVQSAGIVKRISPTYYSSMTTADSTLTATGGQTAFTFASVPSTYSDYHVFINGVKWLPTVDYTTSGNVITLGQALDVGDKVNYVRIK